MNEDKVAYDAHLNAYLARYSPVDKLEADLVGHLAYSMWQIMRNNSIEVALFDIETSTIDVQVHENFEKIDQYGRLALAFKKSAGDNAFELIRRYKTSAERSYHRALKALEELLGQRTPVPVEAAPEASVRTPEPTPRKKHIACGSNPSPK